MSGEVASGPWGKMPRRLFEDKSLSKGAIRTYGVLRCFANANEGETAWPSVGTLAAILGTDRRNVQQWLKELVLGGYIIRERRTRAKGGYDSNRYHFPDFPPQADAVDSYASPAVDSYASVAVEPDASHAVDTRAQTDKGTRPPKQTNEHRASRLKSNELAQTSEPTHMGDVVRDVVKSVAREKTQPAEEELTPAEEVVET
jgi:hypothetical protein